MFNAHDLIADELLHDHSLGALDYLNCNLRRS